MTRVTAASPRRAALLRDIMTDHPRATGTAMRLTAAIADQLGMPANDLHCLNLLVSAGTATPSWLAERLGMTTSAATKMLDRLERAGYLARSNDPDDRRKIIVRPDVERIEALGSYFEPMWNRMNEVLARYTDEQLEFVIEFNRLTTEITEEHINRVRAEGHAHPTRTPHVQ
jgi:DNA-binding MarR family transcriptional regulator